MGARRLIVLVPVLAVLAAPPPAGAVTNVQIAGLQAALRAHGLYRGPIDAIAGPATARGVRAFQRRARLPVDGVAGIRTRIALGPLGRPLFGRRVLRQGAVGWDVSVLQFLLRRSGAPVPAIDGRFGAATARALVRLQRRAGLVADGVAGPATFAVLDPARKAPVAKPRPAAPRHVVRPGETLTGIADRYMTSVAALARANGLDPDRILPAGVRLAVPSSAGPPAGQPLGVRLSLDRWARHYRLDPRLLRALAWQESGHQPHVVSPAGAFGVMQVTAATWEFVETVLLGRKVPRTADGNVRVGAAYLRHLLDLFGGDERLALGAYYRGPAAVRRYGLGPETRAFVANVLALRERM